MNAITARPKKAPTTTTPTSKLRMMKPTKESALLARAAKMKCLNLQVRAEKTRCSSKRTATRTTKTKPRSRKTKTTIRKSSEEENLCGTEKGIDNKLVFLYNGESNLITTAGKLSPSLGQAKRLRVCVFFGVCSILFGRRACGECPLSMLLIRMEWWA